MGCVFFIDVLFVCVKDEIVWVYELEILWLVMGIGILGVYLFVWVFGDVVLVVIYIDELRLFRWDRYLDVDLF